MGLRGGCWLCHGPAPSCRRRPGIQLEGLGQEAREWGCVEGLGFGSGTVERGEGRNEGNLRQASLKGQEEEEGQSRAAQGASWGAGQRGAWGPLVCVNAAL